MNKPRFLYQQIADSLNHKINAGFFPEGKLPPERFLAELFGVNRLTLRRALTELKANKILRSAGRRGTFTLSQQEITQLKIGICLNPQLPELPTRFLEMLLEYLPEFYIQLIDYNNIKKYNHINIILQFSNSAPELSSDSELPKVIFSLDKIPASQIKSNHCNFFADSRKLVINAIDYLKNQPCKRLAIICSTTDTEHLKYIPHYHNLVEKSRFGNAPLPVTFINLNYTKNSIIQISELLRNQKPDGIILADPLMLSLVQAAQIKTRYHSLNTVALAPWGVSASHPMPVLAPDAAAWVNALTAVFTQLSRNDKATSPYVEISNQLYIPDKIS